MPRWKRALVQSALAGGFIALSFLAIGRMQGRLAMASLAASAFIVFSFAASESAQPRHLLGSYACGLVLGGAACLLRHALHPALCEDRTIIILFCAAAVALCSLCMNLLDVQHPPAAALALAMVLEARPIPIGLATMACVLVLALLRRLALRFLGPYLESM